jgi:hypothetical protein
MYYDTIPARGTHDSDGVGTDMASSTSISGRKPWPLVQNLK